MGREIAKNTNTKLMVVNVQKKNQWGKKLSKEMNYIFATAKKYEAEMLIFFSDSPAAILKDCIDRSNVKQIVLENNDYENIGHIEHLDKKSEEVEIHILKC